MGAALQRLQALILGLDLGGQADAIPIHGRVGLSPQPLGQRVGYCIAQGFGGIAIKAFGLCNGGRADRGPCRP